MNDQTRKYLSTIGSKGGKASRRTLTTEQAQAMLLARKTHPVSLDVRSSWVQERKECGRARMVEKSTSERSPTVAKMEAEGKIKPAKGIPTADTLVQPDEYSQEMPNYE